MPTGWSCATKCWRSFPASPKSAPSRRARALGLLDAEPFRLLVCDLKMPRMDGLQVLSIVRRRFPELRTVVLTGLEDEEFRSRAYALGVDLFWLKTDMQQNTQMFLDCLESLLGRDMEGGFRGIQSKSLMDIIQMECLSRSSTVLRITRGPLVAKLWIQDGELIDAEAEGARGEAAFRRILAWKSGTFENLPAEPERERTIIKPVNALLLESAQTIDETANPVEPGIHRANRSSQDHLETRPARARRRRICRRRSAEGQGEIEALGTQSAEPTGRLDAAGHRSRQTAGRTARSRPVVACRRQQFGTASARCCRRKTNLFSSAGRRMPPPTNCLKKPKNLSHHGIL